MFVDTMAIRLVISMIDEMCIAQRASVVAVPVGHHVPGSTALRGI